MVTDLLDTVTKLSVHRPIVTVSIGDLLGVWCLERAHWCILCPRPGDVARSEERGAIRL